MIATSEASPHRRYRLIAQIGRGGMAEVYLAVAQGPGGFNKLVVVKKTLQDLALRPEILSMFMNEARLAARMNHPNVVQTHELGEEEGRQFIAMEFLDGQPYSRILMRLRGRSGGPEALGLPHHLRVLIDTLAGLHHAHELRDFDGTPLHVVHRDVTPHNVFVTYDGSIKVVDFGIAKAHDSSSNTVTGEIKGKVSYMSPEQVRGAPLDRRSDVFAVGVMLWEAIAGHRMWGDLPDVTVLHELMNGSVPSIRAEVPGVPEELARIVDRALAVDPDHRYPSALAMQRELDELTIRAGMRVDGAEVGRVVSELFAQERRRVQGVIEAQLGSLRWTGEGPAASLPFIPAPQAVAPSEVSGSSNLIADGGRTGGAYASMPTHAGTALSMRAPPPSSKRLVVMLVGVALAAVTVLVLAIMLIAPRRPAEPVAAVSVPAEPGPGARAPSAPESVSLQVRVSPAEARIFLDGVLLGGGAYEGKVQRGEAERVLRVEAEGHRPKEEKVVLTSDLVMSVALEKIPTEAAPSATTPRRTGPLPGQAPPSRTSGRGIDAESPYK